MLDERQERQVAVVDIQPVDAGHELTLQAEDQYVCAVVFGARVALDELTRQVRCESGEEPGRQRDQQSIELVDVAGIRMDFDVALTREDALRR